MHMRSSYHFLAGLANLHITRYIRVIYGRLVKGGDR